MDFLNACVRNKINVVKFLFCEKCGIDKIATYDDDMNGMMLACICENLDVILFLHEFGVVPIANINFHFDKEFEDHVNLKIEERLNFIFRFDNLFKNIMFQLPLSICEIILIFVHGAENLKRKIFFN